MEAVTRGELLTMVAAGLYSFISWLFQFARFLLRVFVAVAIVWGFIASLAPFPFDTIRHWQELVSSTSPNFLGAKLFIWCAANWVQIAVIVLLFNSVHMRHVTAAIGTTSGHAAFAASALANYMSVNPTTPRLLGTEKKRGAWQAFWKPMFSEAIYSRQLSIFGGVPFLPDEAIPERDGRKASLQEDLARAARASSYD